VRVVNDLKRPFIIFKLELPLPFLKKKGKFGNNFFSKEGRSNAGLGSWSSRKLQSAGIIPSNATLRPSNRMSDQDDG
jgi:hypothetical protein